MKVLRIFDQYRRDCHIEIECENCGYRMKRSAYDDRNFWDNVIPNMKCPKCEKSTNDINPRIRQYIKTLYPEGYQI